MDRAVYNKLLALALLALAACAGPSGGLRAGSVLRSIDNDVLDRSDDQYTSGLSLSYVGRPEETFEQAALPGGIPRALDDSWPFPDQPQRFVLHSLSHRIFTTDLDASEVVVGDLPYSALL